MIQHLAIRESQDFSGVCTLAISSIAVAKQMELYPITVTCSQETQTTRGLGAHKH